MPTFVFIKNGSKVSGTGRIKIIAWQTVSTDIRILGKFSENRDGQTDLRKLDTHSDKTKYWHSYDGRTDEVVCRGRLMPKNIQLPWHKTEIEIKG